MKVLTFDGLPVEVLEFRVRDSVPHIMFRHPIHGLDMIAPAHQFEIKG